MNPENVNWGIITYDPEVWESKPKIPKPKTPRHQTQDTKTPNTGVLGMEYTEIYGYQPFTIGDFLCKPSMDCISFHKYESKHMRSDLKQQIQSDLSNATLSLEVKCYGYINGKRIINTETVMFETPRETITIIPSIPSITRTKNKNTTPVVLEKKYTSTLIETCSNEFIIDAFTCKIHQSNISFYDNTDRVFKLRSKGWVYFAHVMHNKSIVMLTEHEILHINPYPDWSLKRIDHKNTPNIIILGATSEGYVFIYEHDNICLWRNDELIWYNTDLEYDEQITHIKAIDGVFTCDTVKGTVGWNMDTKIIVY